MSIDGYPIGNLQSSVDIDMSENIDKQRDVFACCPSVETVRPGRDCVIMRHGPAATRYSASKGVHKGGSGSSGSD